MTAKKERYHHGDLRAALLEETTRMIHEAGVESVTLRALSERIGVSRAAPYRHFVDKTALLCAVAEQGFQRLTRNLRQVTDQGRDDALAIFMEQGVVYVQFAVSNPPHYQLMFSPILQSDGCTPELKAAAGAAYDVLLETIGHCQAGGGLRPGDPGVLAQTTWATLHGLATLLIDRLIDTDDPDRLTRCSLSALLTGLRDDGP